MLGSSGTNYIFAFNPGETLPEGALAETWYHSALADALAGTDLGVANDLPAYMGLLLEHEINTLTNLLESSDHPFVAVIGTAGQIVISAMAVSSRGLWPAMLGGCRGFGKPWPPTAPPRRAGWPRRPGRPA